MCEPISVSNSTFFNPRVMYRANGDGSYTSVDVWALRSTLYKNCEVHGNSCDTSKLLENNGLLEEFIYYDQDEGFDSGLIDHFYEKKPEEAKAE